MNEGRFLKDGFSGQQLVVLPRPVAAAAARHPLLRGLYATDAGYFPEAAAHGVERKHGLEGVVLIVCRAGRGWLRLGVDEAAGTQEVGPGDAVLIAPGQAHAYGADETSAWTIQWVHFCGDEVAAWWRWLCMPPGGGVRRLRAGGLEQLDLGRVHEQLAAGYDERHLLAAAAALRWALACLGVAMSAADSGEPTRLAVEAVEAWMREHSGGRVTLAELARRARLSPAHFSALFRKRFGFAPIDYFLRLKIRRACNLLDTTEWPVGRVAAEVGIEDGLYFSRRFRRVMGVAPRDYRRAKKG